MTNETAPQKRIYLRLDFLLITNGVFEVPEADGQYKRLNKVFTENAYQSYKGMIDVTDLDDFEVKLTRIEYTSTYTDQDGLEHKIVDRSEFNAIQDSERSNGYIQASINGVKVINRGSYNEDRNTVDYGELVKASEVETFSIDLKPFKPWIQKNQ